MNGATVLVNDESDMHGIEGREFMEFRYPT